MVGLVFEVPGLGVRLWVNRHLEVDHPRDDRIPSVLQQDEHNMRPLPGNQRVRDRRYRKLIPRKMYKCGQTVLRENLYQKRTRAVAPLPNQRLRHRHGEVPHPNLNRKRLG
jgi:hypothetical protein